MEQATMPLSTLQPDPTNRRADLGDVNGLAENIIANGLIVPLLVRRDGRIIAGHRRYAALVQVHGDNGVDIDVRIVPDETSEADAVVMQAVENLQRENISPIDEASLFSDLSNFMNQTDIAARVGRSQPYISKRIKLLNLPSKVQDMLVKGKLRLDDALDLADVSDILSAEELESIAGRNVAGIALAVAHARDTQVQRKVASWCEDNGLIAFLKIQDIEKEQYAKDDKDKPIKPALDYGADVQVKVKADAPSTKDVKSGQVIVRPHRDGGARVVPIVYESVPDERSSTPEDRLAKARRRAKAEMRAHVGEHKFPNKTDTVNAGLEFMVHTTKYQTLKEAAMLLGLEPVVDKQGGKDYASPLYDAFQDGSIHVVAAVVIGSFISQYPFGGNQGRELLEKMGFDFNELDQAEAAG